MDVASGVEILVLEDSLTDFELLRYQLKSDQMEPQMRHTINRDEFLQSLEARQPDLVIADFNLPNFNGLEALRLVKSQDAFLPFILLTGSINHEQEREVLRAGADDVIFKSNLGRMPFAIKRSLKDARDKEKLQETTQKLEASLHEKEILIQEIHHRVKNNLALVSGLLELKKFGSTDNEIHRLLNKLILKIKSIALVHETLYGSQSFSQINFSNFLNDLVGYLSQLYDSEERQIQIQHNEFDLVLNVNQAIPLGLMISELSMNAVQHAFEEQKNGLLKIEVTSSDDETVLVEISDNGTGMPQDTQLDQEQGYGVRIIKALVKQINADLKVEHDNGTRYLISFEKEEKKGIGNALL